MRRNLSILIFFLICTTAVAQDSLYIVANHLRNQGMSVSECLLKIYGISTKQRHQVTKLGIYMHGIDSIYIYADLFPNLKSLYLKCRDIADLKGIEQFQEIEDLSVRFDTENEVLAWMNFREYYNLSRLAKLKKIKKIELDIEVYTPITFLKHLDNLERIDIKIHDYRTYNEFVGYLKDLKRLKIIKMNNPYGELLKLQYNDSFNIITTQGNWIVEKNYKYYTSAGARSYTQDVTIRSINQYQLMKFYIDSLHDITKTLKINYDQNVNLEQTEEGYKSVFYDDGIHGGRQEREFRDFLYGDWFVDYKDEWDHKIYIVDTTSKIGYFKIERKDNVVQSYVRRDELESIPHLPEVYTLYGIYNYKDETTITFFKVDNSVKWAFFEYYEANPFEELFYDMECYKKMSPLEQKLYYPMDYEQKRTHYNIDSIVEKVLIKFDYYNY